MALVLILPPIGLRAAMRAAAREDGGAQEGNKVRFSHMQDQDVKYLSCVLYSRALERLNAEDHDARSAAGGRRGVEEEARDAPVL
jgi:hypothetical protein